MSRQSYPGVGNTLKVADRVFTDLDNLIILHGSVKAGSSAFYSSPRQQGASAGYQVPANKVLKVIAIETVVQNATAIAGSAGTVGYADNDMGIAGNTGPTNNVYRGGAAGSAKVGSGVDIGSRREEICDFSVPATKYPFFIQDVAATETVCTMYCYLEDA